MARRASHIEGMAGCLAALRELGQRVENTVGRRGLRTTAKKLAERHKATLPVSTDPNNKTPGSLRASPSVKAAKGGKGRQAT